MGAAELEEILTREVKSIDVTFEGVSREALEGQLASATRVLVTESALQVTVPDYDAARRIISKAESAGGRLMALTPRGESLEEYFLRTQSARAEPSSAEGPA